MSEVTNVILHFSILEDDVDPDWPQEDNFILIRKINEWLIQEGYGKFTEVKDNFNPKHLEAPIFAAAFNMFEPDKFIKFIKSLPWRCLECVQIFIQEQDDCKFTLIELKRQTKEKPKVSGFYWFRGNVKGYVENLNSIVEVKLDACFGDTPYAWLLGTDESPELSLFEGEWYGPLEIPE